MTKEKLKKLWILGVQEENFFDCLQKLLSTQPLLDYLANAGCLKHLKTVDDRDRLVEDVLMFQVINRVRGPFERYFKCSLKILLFFRI